MKTKIIDSKNVIFFFIVVFFAYLFIAPQYGYPSDEPAEQVILRENMMEYTYHFKGVDSLAYKYYENLGVERSFYSVEMDHGQSAYYLFTPFLTSFTNNQDVLMVLWRLYTSLIFLMGCICLYKIMRLLSVGQFISCITVLLYIICPRFFAEGHYNNKDMILLSLSLCLLYSGFKTIKQTTPLNAFIFSLIGAITANTKIIGLFLWGLIAVGILLHVIIRKKLNKTVIISALVAFFSFFIFYILLTPAIWSDPLKYLQHVWENANSFTRWSGVVLFRGVIFDYDTNPLPRYYIIYMILMTTPIYVLIFTLIGQLSALVTIIKSKEKLLTNTQSLFYLIITLFWIIPLGYQFICQTLVYNGWRHFYFVYASLAILCGVGLNTVITYFINKNKKFIMALSVLLAICILFTAGGIILNHPNQNAYYNIVGRLLSPTNGMELDYWNLSAVNAIKELLNKEKNAPIILGTSDPMSWHGIYNGYNVLSEKEKDKLTIVNNINAPYLFVNTTYQRIYNIEIPENYVKYLEIESYGQTIAVIYAKNSK